MTSYDNCRNGGQGGVSCVGTEDGQGKLSVGEERAAIAIE
jgi:hypothetical protein